MAYLFYHTNVLVIFLSLFHLGNLEEHIKLIAELVPKWLQILPVRKCFYVKLAKNLDVNNVINTLSEVKKKEEASA